jgi:hypothetical protein
MPKEYLNIFLTGDFSSPSADLQSKVTPQRSIMLPSSNTQLSWSIFFPFWGADLDSRIVYKPPLTETSRHGRGLAFPLTKLPLTWRSNTPFVVSPSITPLSSHLVAFSWKKRNNHNYSPNDNNILLSFAFHNTIVSQFSHSQQIFSEWRLIFHSRNFGQKFQTTITNGLLPWHKTSSSTKCNTTTCKLLFSE